MSLLDQADKVVCLHERYVEGCLLERNRFMVDNSSMIIALYDGKAGGTKYTVEYAKRNNKNVVLIGV